jgi:hypothetical protein
LTLCDGPCFLLDCKPEGTERRISVLGTVRQRSLLVTGIPTHTAVLQCTAAYCHCYYHTRIKSAPDLLSG